MEGKNTEDCTQQVSANEETLKERILSYSKKDGIKHYKALITMLDQYNPNLEHHSEQVAREQLYIAIKEFTDVYITVQRKLWEDKLLKTISVLGADETQNIYNLLRNLSDQNLDKDVWMERLDEFYNNSIFQDLPDNKAWNPELKYNANNNNEDPAAQQGGEQDL
ncbi:hypothetical protein ACEPAG_1906 [Sanghuangporus baumii]